MTQNRDGMQENVHTTTIVHVPVRWPLWAQHSQPVKSYYGTGS